MRKKRTKNSTNRTADNRTNLARARRLRLEDCPACPPGQDKPVTGQKSGQIKVSAAPNSNSPASKAGQSGPSIQVIPWPSYSGDGCGPFWTVRVEGNWFRCSVVWASHLRRWVGGESVSRLRKRAPAAWIEAERLIAELVASKGAARIAQDRASFDNDPRFALWRAMR